MKTKCQLTGIEFEGRGKNHPALRGVLENAFENGTRSAVIERLEDARRRGVSSIEDFVAIASGAEVAAVADQKAARDARISAESDFKNERRRREERNAKLRAAGFRWVKRVDVNEQMLNDEDDYHEEANKEWCLLDASGKEVSVKNALDSIK